MAGERASHGEFILATIGFNHYNLRAPRDLLEQLREFYCRVIGLRVGSRPPFESFGYWLYAGEQDILHLSESHPPEVRLTHALTTFDHVALTCTRPAETQAHLDRCGVPYDRAVVPLVGRLQLFLRDPAGNGVELSFVDTGG